MIGFKIKIFLVDFYLIKKSKNLLKIEKKMLVIKIGPGGVEPGTSRSQLYRLTIRTSAFIRFIMKTKI